MPRTSYQQCLKICNLNLTVGMWPLSWTLMAFYTHKEIQRRRQILDSFYLDDSLCNLNSSILSRIAVC